jgi:hypothetical protein
MRKSCANVSGALFGIGLELTGTVQPRSGAKGKD